MGWEEAHSKNGSGDSRVEEVDRWGGARLPVPATKNGTGGPWACTGSSAGLQLQRADGRTRSKRFQWQRGVGKILRRLAACLVHRLLVSGCRPRSGDVLLFESFGKTLHVLPLSLVLGLRGRRSVNSGRFAVSCACFKSSWPPVALYCSLGTTACVAWLAICYNSGASVQTSGSPRPRLYSLPTLTLRVLSDSTRCLPRPTPYTFSATSTYCLRRMEAR
jgi:hypothetical protein